MTERLTSSEPDNTIPGAEAFTGRQRAAYEKAYQVAKNVFVAPEAPKEAIVYAEEVSRAYAAAEASKEPRQRIPFTANHYDPYYDERGQLRENEEYLKEAEEREKRIRAEMKEMGFLPRTTTAIAYAARYYPDLNSVQDLRYASDDDLRGIRNLGVVALAQIRMIVGFEPSEEE